MRRVYRCPAARRDLIAHYCYLSENAGEAIAEWFLSQVEAKPTEVQEKRRSWINARIVKALTGRYFRHMLRKDRAIIPAGGWFEWLRHEVACMIVRRSYPAEPAVPSAVPYEVWRFGNGPSKSPRTMQPPSQDGCRTRERTACLPASRRVGARVDGMVSVSEPR